MAGRLYVHHVYRHPGYRAAVISPPADGPDKSSLARCALVINDLHTKLKENKKKETHAHSHIKLLLVTRGT